MYGCQNWQCSAGHSPEPTAKKYKKTTYEKITNDGVQVENLDPTGLRKILLYVPVHEDIQHTYIQYMSCMYVDSTYMTYILLYITTYIHTYNILAKQLVILSFLRVSTDAVTCCQKLRVA